MISQLSKLPQTSDTDNTKCFVPSITTDPKAGGWEHFSPQLDFLLSRPSFLIRPQSAYEIFYILQSREAWSNGMCPLWRSLYCKPCPTWISPLSNGNTLGPSSEVTILLIHGDMAYGYDWTYWLPSCFSLTEESPQLNGKGMLQRAYHMKA